MAGEKLKGPFSFKVAKKILSQADLERLACAFLATENVYQFDHNKAATEFGGSKPDSFRRQIWVITKKIKGAMESDDGDDDDGSSVSPPSKPTAGSKPARKTGGGQKRKADDEELNGGGGKKRTGKSVKSSTLDALMRAGEGAYGHGAVLAVKAEPRLEDSEGDHWD